MLDFHHKSLPLYMFLLNHKHSEGDSHKIFNGGDNMQKKFKKRNKMNES